MARGVDGREVFSDDHDRAAFLETLGRVVAESGAETIAYCLMGNHFHLLFRVGVVPLSSVMQRVLTAYSTKYNRRHERTGHLFQARYKAILCLDDAYLFGLIRYIHMNPVRAGLVADPLDWPWSSARLNDPGPGDLVGFDPWRNDVKRELDLTRRVEETKSSLESIYSRIAARTNVSVEIIRSENKARPLVAVRREFAKEALRGGFSLSAIARWLGTSVASIVRYRDK